MNGGGVAGATRGRHRRSGTRVIWREVAGDFTTVPVPVCGNLPHEARLDIVDDAPHTFLKGCRLKEWRT